MIMKDRKISAPERWILWGIPVIFAAGAALHFVYALTGKNAVVGAISAVNESTWEHMKLLVLPTILWWSLYFAARHKKYDLSARRWFTSQAVSLIASIVLIPLLFYTVTQGLSIENTVADILIFLASAAVGQIIALHFYRHFSGVPTAVSASVVALILAAFVVFTFCPPDLPIFVDPLTGGRGINHETDVCTYV